MQHMLSGGDACPPLMSTATRQTNQLYDISKDLIALKHQRRQFAEEQGERLQQYKTATLSSGVTWISAVTTEL